MATGTALTGRTGTNIHLEYSGAVEIGTPKTVVSRFSPISWTWGVGENQVNVLFQDSRSIGIAGETLDLTTGQEDCFGNVLSMTAIKFFYLKNTHATLVLEVFGNTDVDLLIISGTTDALEIPPGGEFYWSAPTAAGIVTTANKKLFIASKTDDTITYDIVAGGLD